ncbi:hypothetical protein D1Y84_11395 [Acidipila sp. EB88]|nr:hypothetical protein D1Y84_11395 [Acidipila sp. EB88]
MQVDTWPKSADHLVEVAGLLMASAHIVFLILIVLWFTVRKPTSFRLFRLRVAALLHGRPLPERLPVPPAR